MDPCRAPVRIRFRRCALTLSSSLVSLPLSSLLCLHLEHYLYRPFIFFFVVLDNQLIGTVLSSHSFRCCSLLSSFAPQHPKWTCHLSYYFRDEASTGPFLVADRLDLSNSTASFTRIHYERIISNFVRPATDSHWQSFRLRRFASRNTFLRPFIATSRTLGRPLHRIHRIALTRRRPTWIRSSFALPRKSSNRLHTFTRR